MKKLRMPVKSGDKYGHLTVIEIDSRAADGHLKWRCRCDCGSMVVRQTNSLKSKGVKSCGCANADFHKKHGMRSSPEYQSWQSAKYRCHNHKSKDYCRYGGSGIFMCDEWRSSFEVFYAHMGERPCGASLDRIDNSRGYEPGNCRWATIAQQASNKRYVVTAEHDGKILTSKELSIVLGISHAAAINRIRRGRIYV